MIFANIAIIDETIDDTSNFQVSELCQIDDDIQSGAPSDDNYEENDDSSLAYDLSAYEATWLEWIDGLGTQLDDDWYEIYIEPGNEHLLITLTFIHSEGDIDINVYNSSFNIVVNNNSDTNNEYIDIIVPFPGIYYLEIYGNDAGNQYNFWWCDLSVTDDNYEENDVYTSAFNLSAYKDMWLNTINGVGFQFDDDWYEIYLETNCEHIMVYLMFSHLSGNLDLALYDARGSIVHEYPTSTDNEIINIQGQLAAGSYFILVSGNDVGNEYDLKWYNSPLNDDNYEPNDNYTFAYDISAYNDTWLSWIDGSGVQLDDDWYKITIAEGYEHLIVELYFTHSYGNIDLALYDSAGTLITSNISTTDDEQIDQLLTSNGIYYIKVYGDSLGNTYVFKWKNIGYTPDKGAIPGYNILLLLGIIIPIYTVSFRIRTKRRSKLQKNL